MISVWLSKLPTIGFSSRWDTAIWSSPKTGTANGGVATPTPPQEKPSSESTIGKLWDGLKNKARGLFTSVAQNTPAGGRPMFLIPEQKSLREQIEAYAESPFEKELFLLKKKPNDYVISKAWANGLKSSDALTREAALTLLKAYLTYTDKANLIELSAHSQMKLVMFASHLTEGGLGKAILYESILSLPLAQFLEFAAALQKDFSTFPPIAQALLLKQMMNRRKQLEKDNLKSYRKLLKNLVISFYTDQQESIEDVFQQQEKIRLGFLKIQPVEEAYQKALEEIERRYRQKLRQLKKNRSQKVAEAEEERMRRIELIYDSVEGDLVTGLKELAVEMDKAAAV